MRGNNATGRIGEPEAWGNSCDGVGQTVRAGSAASGLLLPRQPPTEPPLSCDYCGLGFRGGCLIASGLVAVPGS